MADSPAPGTVFLIKTNHQRKDTTMRRTITLGTVGIAGVVTAGLLALPIAAAVTGGDDAVKRDEDAPEMVLVDEDDRDDDAADPVTRATRDHTRDQAHDGQSDHDGPTHDPVTGGVREDQTGQGPKGADQTGRAAADDVSGAEDDGPDDDVSRPTDG